MIRSELISRSPLRILERSTHGGVGAGNVGVIAGPKGIGKTACLVHIATDDLFRGRHVIHVSFSANSNHIVTWYENIFAEIARRCRLDDATGVHDEIVRNRIIMNFRQDAARWPHVIERIRTLISSNLFTADAVIVDGYDFSAVSVADLRLLRAFAAELKLEFWFSVDAAGTGVPAVLRPVAGEIAVIIVLVDKGPYIHLELIKDHDIDSCSDLHLKLDPAILLIAEEP